LTFILRVIESKYLILLLIDMQINFIAALLVGVASMAMGFVWYGPLFAKMWMKEIGMSEETMKGGPGVGYLIAFLSSTLMGAVTSVLSYKLGLTNVMDGLMIGVLVGVGYVATTFATNYIFGKKSLRLYFIDAGYQTLLVIVAFVIATLVR
jgi:hypothetical protein